MGVQGRADQQNVPFVGSGSTLLRDSETVMQNAGRVNPLVCHTLMGKAAISVPAAGVIAAGNTGNGTLTALALIPGIMPRLGTWLVQCIAAVANGGVFEIVDPNGNVVENSIVMAPGAGAATVFYKPAVGLKFTLTDGGVDFAVGDKFSVLVAAVNKWVPFDPAGVDGRQIPRGIFAGDDIAAASLVGGDVTPVPIIVAGVGATFDCSLLTIENGATIDTGLPSGQSVREALYALGMFAQDTIDFDVPEN